MSAKSQQVTQSNKSGVDATLARHGGLSYLEMPAVDAWASATFYAKVVGWNVEGIDTDQPKFSDATGHLIGRWITGLAVVREPGLLPFIYVNDVREAVEAAVANRGEVVKALIPRETCSLRQSVIRPAT